MQAKAYAAQSATTPLAPFTVDRREPGPKDVAIDILYCGVCHSDLHTVRGEWPGILFPSVPGHEIVGRVTAVGGEVGRFKTGDIVAVGCMVDSCRTCPSCGEGLEQYCEGEFGFTATYNGPLRPNGENTYGGYSAAIVVDEHFVLSVRHGEEHLAAVAPLLCAGITTWSPLRHHRVGPGSRVGIVGLGGLGHMGLKFARALGAHVVAFTTSPSKTVDALRLGAHEVVVSTDHAAMAARRGSLDFVLDTVSAPHDVNAYLSLLRRDGNLTLVGAPPKPLVVAPMALIFGRRNVSGSLIGGLAETQEMLDFCGQHGIVADVEMVRIQDVNTAWERLLKADVKFRFVIDMASLRG